MMKETFTDNFIPLQNWSNIPQPDKLKIENPSQFRFCLDQRDIPVNSSSYYSTNQALAAPPNKLAGNPRTRIPPLVVPKAADFQYWSEDFVIPQGINDETNQELYLSGYVDPNNMCGKTSSLKAEFVPSNYQPQPYPKQSGNKIIEPFVGENKMSDGDVYGCTYQPSHLKHNIPSNQLAGECSLNDAYNDFNKNLYTQSIDSNVYARNEIIEPLNSNIGISWTQQFPPVTCTNEDGDRVYVSQDPRLATPKQPIQHPPVAENSNIYDPRYEGYGTSYRQYVDPLTGQSRFYYDDVDVIRRPNYIVRSNIDDAPWADSYGPMSDNSNMSADLNHALANRKFLENQMDFRTHLQERYMRKYNSEVGWQRRQFPIHTTTKSSLKTL